MSAIAHPTREDYLPHVRVFMPAVQGEELEMRASLLLMRDRAMATKGFCSEEAWHILDHVERLASRYAFTPMPKEDVGELRRILLNLVAAASSLEGVFAPQLPFGEPQGNG